MRKTNKIAFTLMELIVVITILAILGTIAFISLQGYTATARDSRRISDISDLQKSLELFFANNGNYPLPDNVGTVSYSGDDVYFQGTIGDNVIRNLGKNITKKPLDPLLETEYIYSVINSKKEYEIMGVFEGNDIVFNTISNTYAQKASGVKIFGTYNKLYVKTKNYIIPIPSIINVEALKGNLILNSNNIKSQVITGKNNIPSFGKNPAQTGSLDIELSIYSGSLTKYSGDDEKKQAISKIKKAYKGTTLANEGKYKNILEKTTTAEMVYFADTSIFNIRIEYLDSMSDPFAPCTEEGQILSSGSSYGNCDTYDIIVCSGIGTGYIIAACNVGTNIAGTGKTISAGSLFQRGNNYGFPNAAFGIIPTITGTVNTIGYGSGNYYTSSQYLLASDWSNPRNDSLWGTNGTEENRQGPCEDGYHIGDVTEWNNIINAGLWGTTNGTKLSEDLKLPMPGIRCNAGGIYTGMGKYWMSTINNTDAKYLQINPTSITTTSGARANGYSIRCFKNSD